MQAKPCKARLPTGARCHRIAQSTGYCNYHSLLQPSIPYSLSETIAKEVEEWLNSSLKK